LKKKKLLWVAHESNKSGANIAMLEFIDALTTEFDSLVVLPHEGNMQIALSERGITSAVIYQYGWTNVYPWWNISKWGKVVLRSVHAVQQLNKVISETNPDIICTNTLVPFIGSISAKLKHKPHVWWIHEFGKEDFGFKTGWSFEKLSFRWMQKSSKLIVCNSKAIMRKFSKAMPQVNMQTVYQPVTWSVHEPVIKKEARFLMFGQIVASKGHKQVLEAMVANRKLGKPVYSLHIKGPNEVKEYLAELRNFVRENQLEDKVVIENGYFVKEKEMPKYEALLVASRAEAFGRVIVEANKAGIPVVIRNSGGAPELVNETNGILYDTEEELAAILCGERSLPEGEIKFNYDEKEQIQFLSRLLHTINKA